MTKWRSYLLTLPLIASAQFPALGQTRPAERIFPPEIEQLLGAARSAPPEIAADVLLRVIERTSRLPRRQRLEMLREAFESAGRATFTVRKKPAPGSNVDTRAGYVGLAHELGLDRLTLQVKAVRAVLDVDAREAHELFARTLPALEPLDCGDDLTYDVSAYYELARELYSRGFTPEDRERGLDQQFLDKLTGDLVSPAQLMPLLNLFSRLDLTAPALRRAALALAARLPAIAIDDRSFSAASTRFDLGNFGHFASLCHKQGIAVQGLFLAFRTYTVTALSGRRCADTVARNTRDPKGHDPLRYLDHTLRVELFPGGEVAAVEGPVEPEKIEPKTPSKAYWTSGTAKDLLARVRQLRFRGKDPLTPQQRASAEWAAEFSAFLAAVDAWNPREEETENDFYHQKCVILSGAAELAASGDMRQAALSRLWAAIASAGIQRSSPAEWLIHAEHIVRRLKSAKAPLPPAVPGDSLATLWMQIHLLGLRS